MTTATAITRTADRMFHGPVHRPGDDGYALARRAWRQVRDLPALIVDVAGPADVAAAFALARDHGLPVAVQRTGHGASATVDGAILLRTVRLGGARVDPTARRARVGGGALLRDVLAAAEPHGLMPLFGSTPWLGAAGFTLGGGVGWLTRAFGYAADSLLGADVVTAAGDLVTVDDGREPELMWGLRGAGGSLAVATSVELALHPVPALYGGAVAFGAADPLELLLAYGEWTADLPDRLSTALVLRRYAAPSPEPLLVALRVLFAGPAADAEPLLQPFLARAGRQVRGTLRPMSPRSYLRTPPPAPPQPHTGVVECFPELPLAVLAGIASFVTAGDSPPSAVEVRHWGGALSRPPRPSPAGPRHVRYGIVAEVPGAPTGVDVPAPPLFALLRRHGSGAAMRNLLADTGATHRAYTEPERARLVALKNAWDPHDLLRTGHRIPLRGWPARTDRSTR
ncbi:FAD-binding oxidoreductase [Phytohabitans suffuscus]|uniref:FAD-linked oxidase n=1 Tax=Phytohabitans suffuscus TaxID=624315 RepID=A0A6F8Y9T7_9ACTN|nr:FAD-binding oxidoreductase [Phytohabitans suffuscus]BCB82894.1 FAD-linked oxidase [Phytohabitans suffuscus]